MNERMLRLIIWRAISLCLSILITGIMTGQWHAAIGIIIVNSLVLMLAQTLYEDYWSKRKQLSKEKEEKDTSGIEFT
jgi:hypothetical protein